MVSVLYCGTIHKFVNRCLNNDGAAEFVTIICGIVCIFFVFMFMYVTCNWIGGSCPL